MKQVYLSCRLSALGKVLFITFFSAVVRMSRASKVHFMTHLAESVGAVPCSSVHSAISSGIDLKITGSPHPQIKNSQGYNSTAKLSSGVRPTFILPYLQDLLRSSFSDDDIVVFSDAESALYATSSSHIKDAFEKVERTDTILFAAERTCWPGDVGCPEIPSEVKSTYKFPHSGGWIARYSVAIKFLTEWVEVSLMLPEKSRHDQSALYQLMTQRGKRNESVAVNIDHNCIIFQTLESTIDKWALANDSNPYMRPDGVVYNPQTQSEPHILIFNKGRSFMAEAEKILWLARTKSRSTLINCRATCISLFQKYPKLKACRVDPTFLILVKSYCHAALPRRNASDHNLSAFYPTIVQHFPVRLDPADMKPVRKGRISMLKEGAKYTMEEYQRILQCSPVQPEIYGRGGALNLMSYIPLTQETVMLVAAYIESACELWEGCRKDVHNFLNGRYQSGTPGHLGHYSNTKLFRIINGSLYWDWPWGRERIIMHNPDYNFKQQFHHVLRFVSDVPDSVFFSGAEIGSLPPNVPVPHFSSSPSGSASSDIPMPWNAPFQFESMRYSHNDYSTINTVPEDPMSHNGYVEVNNNTIDEAYRASFAKRLDKAAFFGSMTYTKHLSSHAVARQVIMNIAYDHPEHLVANWTICYSLIGNLLLFLFVLTQQVPEVVPTLPVSLMLMIYSHTAHAVYFSVFF